MFLLKPYGIYLFIEKTFKTLKKRKKKKEELLAYFLLISFLEARWATLKSLTRCSLHIPGLQFHLFIDFNDYFIDAVFFCFVFFPLVLCLLQWLLAHHRLDGIGNS